MKFTSKHIKQLQSSGKIRGFSSSYKRVVVPREKPKGIAWLETNLAYWCNSRCVTLEQEYRFDPERRWLSDFAIPAFKVLVEYEGGIFMARGGHNSPKGIQRDISKYNSAQVLGWKVIRCTCLDYTTVIKTLNSIVK